MASEATKEHIATVLKWSMVANAVLVALLYCTQALPYDYRQAGMFVIFPIIALLLAQVIGGVAALFMPGIRMMGGSALLTAPVFFVAAALPVLAGAAWGRPLRIKGRQLHPDLKEGSDWTKGERPDASKLDPATRKALATLWLHDAQKEHASVPAFSRLSWMLAAVGAPAELMEWSHRAALEEIEHTRLCFALAAGYGGKSYSVEPMPDLLIGGLDVEADPIVVMASESLSDGCQLEDYNADVAAACALVCEEPATRKVLEQIAREERSHADFSWALLEWLLNRSPEKVLPAIEKTLENLSSFQRPTAVSWDKKPIVALADPVLMQKHGRLPDERWGELWDIRHAETKRRLGALLKVKKAA
ncbi:MAG: ferritin-like domain-containing protein [Alphaproteobacteria bacterium]|nr:MAG: ferritin-like domain-containing protein [Alphaproteobacteria bacterium]